VVIAKKGAVPGIFIAIFFGIVIFAVGIIAASGLPQFQFGFPGFGFGFGGGAEVPTGPAPRLVFSEDPGQLGSPGEVIRHIDLGEFIVGYGIAKKAISSEAQANITAGIFGGDSRSWTISNATKGSISFEIADTNRYGDLQVILNGQVVRSVREKGSYVIDLDFSPPPAQNILVLAAASSGFKFWAPTTYILSNLVVAVEGFGQQTQTFTFNLSKGELGGLTLASLSFWLKLQETSKVEPLTVELNGAKIYDEVPSLPAPQVTWTPDKINLSVGQNNLTFRTGSKALYSLEKVDFAVFSQVGRELVTYTRRFDLTRSAVLALGNPNATGELSFYVDAVQADTGLNVSINSLNMTFPSLTANKTVASNFSVGALAEKNNTLTLKTSGAYKLSRLRVRVIG